MTLTSLELDEAREAAEQDLVDTCQIHTHSRAPTSGGGWTDTWAPGATVACRIAPLRAGGGEGPVGSGTTRTGGRIVDETTHVLTLPALTVITENDRIVHAGTTYNVTLVRARTWEITRRVEVREKP